MLSKLALVAAVALLAATSAWASGDATATLSSSSPGASRVGLTIVLQDVTLQCGRPDIRSLTVVLPRAMRVPRSISVEAVRLSGRPVASVRTDGTTIQLSTSARPGITCDSLVLGSARLELTRAAALGNPANAGTYAFTVEAKPHGEVWHGSLEVHR